jgi:hypothetical protein
MGGSMGGPTGGPAGPDHEQDPRDATAAMPRRDFDSTAQRRDFDSDATRVRPPVDATRVAAAYDQPTGYDQPTEPRWAASAAVPTPVPAREYEYLDGPEPVPDDAERNWLRPVAFGFLGLLLLGALLTGVWLIFTADNEPPPAAEASAPAATSAAPAPTTATSAPPTSAPPSTAPPVTVTVPTDLVGLSEDEARQRLTDAGLRVQVTRRADATMAPGTVLETQPEPGSQVEPNSVVRLVVAIAPQPSGPGSSDDDE